MNNISRTTEAELRSSVESLRYSSLTSIVMMLLGVAVIAASFVYSITRLRPLEHQIESKHQELDDLQQKKVDLQAEMAETQRQLTDTQNSLENAKKALADARASLESNQNPSARVQQTLRIVSDASTTIDKKGVGPTLVTLSDTTWDYTNGATHYLIKFLPGGKYHYRNDKGQWFDGRWSQSGRTVYIVTSNGAEQETGIIKGDRIEGSGQSDTGGYTWTATRISK